MSLEAKLEKRFVRLELAIGERLGVIEAAFLQAVAQLEQRVKRLERHERRDDAEVLRLERIVARLAALEHRDEIDDAAVERRVDRIEHKLRPHHYPATTRVTVKPA